MKGRIEQSYLLINFILFFKVTFAQEPTLTLMPDHIRKKLGEGIYVSCTPNVPNPKLITNMEWRGPNDLAIPNKDESITTLDGLDSTKQLDLYIKQLKLDDGGTYTCSATYAGTQKLTKTIEVEAYRDISFKDTETLQTPVLNTDAKIRCIVTSDPPPVVDWLKDGVQIEDASDERIIQQSDGILIKGITERDEGVYRCRARVQALGEIKFKDIQVEVHIRPKITGAPKDNSGVEKESVAFACIATGKPAPIYTWVNKDSEVLNKKEGYYVDENSGELKILNLRPDHAGKYKCTAKNAAGEDFAEATLRVLTKPKVEQYLNITIGEGKEAVMRCIITGDPIPDAVFKKEVNPDPFTTGINDDGRIEVQQTMDDERRVGILKISDVSRKDDGLYTCSGVSTGGETVAWGHITVEFKPTFEHQTQDEFWSWEQEPVNLTCLATSIPNATIQWHLRERPIREDDPNLEVLSRGPAGLLRVHPEDGSYFDNYTCQATNTMGVTNHHVMLRQVQKPGPVSSAQVEKTSATTVSWAIRGPLDDGGRPVSGYTVQFRLENTGWDKAQKKFWTKDSSYVVDHLTPLATYIFRFAARNDVGDGEWSGQKKVNMPKVSFPEEPLIFSVDEQVKTIPYTDHYDLQWQVPLDNGEPIFNFEIVYYQVQNSTNGWALVGSSKETVDVKAPGESTYTLEDLKSDSYYKIELRARNKIGFSTPAEAIIKTAHAPSVEKNKEVKSDSNPGLIIAIVIIVLLILLVIVDVVLYFAKNIGLIAFLVAKFGAKPNEKDKEAMIEDGTKSSKPDDNSNKELDKVTALKELSKEKECTETTPMITGDTDKEAIKSEEKEKEEEIKKTTAATNEGLTKDSSV